jgi:hypothetical protein
MVFELREQLTTTQHASQEAVAICLSSCERANSAYSDIPANPANPANPAYPASLTYPIKSTNPVNLNNNQRLL